MDEAEEKKKAKILQFFVEDKHKQRPMKTAMARGKDTVFQLKQQLNPNPNRYICTIHFNESELEDGKILYSYGIPDNSTLVMELSEIPGTADEIPCDKCGHAFPIEIYMLHSEACTKKSTKSSVNNNSRPKTEDDPLIPCENCAQYFPFSKFMDHVSTCN